ncbi:MAG: hypothetical protein HY313_01925 [Acidobacteria bacterium]|nr:hypothetical protein [Acidobacteriota bacterium]
MNVDRLTKALLGSIAVALWIIALTPWITRPITASAQDAAQLSTVESYLSYVSSALSSMRTDLSNIEEDIDHLEAGTCKNKKLCQ